MKQLVIIIIYTLLSSCGRNFNLELDAAASLMQDKPDSAYSILSTINLKEISKRHDKARYALLYSEALDKNYLDVDDDSLIRYAVDYYNRHGKDIDKAKSLYYNGIVHYNALNIDEAMKSFVKAGIYAENIDDFYLKGLIYNVIGNLYYDQCSFNEAVEMYSNAADAFFTAGSKQNLLFAKQSKGLALAYLNQDRQAFENLEGAISIAIEHADTISLLDLISSLGAIRVKMEVDSSSLQAIKTELFRMYNIYNKNIIPIEHYPIIGNIYFKENRLDSARYYFTEYLQKEPTITEGNLSVFAMLSSIESQSNHYREALKYETLLSYYTDSVNTAQKNILIQNLEKKYKADYYKKTYNTLQLKYKYETTILILVISIIILLIGVLSAYFRRIVKERNKRIAENESYIEEVRCYYSQLKTKYECIIKDVRGENSQALFGMLDNRINSLKKVLMMASKYENNTDAFLKNFKEHIKVVSGNNQELAADVIALANLTCHGIIEHLKKFYPSLSQRELCYCGFVCLGFSPESIRILYNHTNIYSIYTLRSKIRSKIGITNNTFNLETYILNMMEKLKDQDDY